MKILRGIRNAFIFVILLFLCLLIYSENWFLSTWDSSIEFSTVVYQLFSPLKGTGKNIMNAYIYKCVYPAVITVGIVAVIYIVFNKFSQKLVFI